MPERTPSFPNPDELLEDIHFFSRPHDPFRDSALALERALRPYERRGAITGFRTWLLSYEASRQRVFFDSVMYLTDLPPNKTNTATLLDWLYHWPDTPAHIVRWSTMFRDVRDKTVTLASGAFRKIPTPTHIRFITEGIRQPPRCQKNVVVYEPAANIEDYRTENTTVFPEKLRTTMLSHIPLVDLVVRNRRFKGQNPLLFWRVTHENMRRVARSYEPILPIYERTHLSVERVLAAPVKTTRNVRISENDLYVPWGPTYSTTEWESACSGEDRFVDMATRFLITKHG